MWLEREKSGAEVSLNSPIGTIRVYGDGSVMHVSGVKRLSFFAIFLTFIFPNFVPLKLQHYNRFPY